MVLKVAFEKGKIDSCISLLTYGAQLPRAGLFADSYRDKDGDNLLYLVLSRADVVTPACISAILKSRPSFVQTPNNANEMPVQVAVCTGVSFGDHSHAFGRPSSVNLTAKTAL